MKKQLLALLITASFPVFATQFHVVLPMPNKAGAGASIAVNLAGQTLPAGELGTPYAGYNLNNLLTVTGDPGFTGTGVSWQVVSGSLPTGMTLFNSGYLSGTPSAAGTASFQVKATYKTKSGQRAYQLVVANLTVGLAAGSPPEAMVGKAYSYNLTPLLTVSGDNAYTGAGVTWSVVSNTLPAGLYLTADGYIGGTPTTAGTGSITARASYKSVNGEQTYQVVSLDIQVALAAATLPAGTVSKTYGPYDFKPLLTVNGDPGYSPAHVTFSTSGGVPPGLSLSADGVLSGTPTTKNTTGNNFQVIASYKTKSGQQAYTIVVNGAVLDVTQIVAGALHSCAITTSGGVTCWGRNDVGQLGDGSTTDRLTPVAVVGMASGVAMLARGAHHACAVTMAGGVKCWGRNSVGQLGDGSTTTRLTPVDVVGLTSGVSKVDAGMGHTCVVTTSGGAKCWGLNDGGQLGDGTKTNQLTPTAVTGLAAGVTQISPGGLHTCAVVSGSAKCWGSNSSGQLGDGTTIDRLTPVTVSGLSSGVTQVTAGYMHACTVTTAGGAKCWGYNYYGQVGDGTTYNRYTPENVSGLGSGVAQIANGNMHSCAVTTSGSAKCWGNNTNSQLGDATLTVRTVPTQVSGLTAGVTQVAAGGSHSCAVTVSGAKCWGYNNTGQLGNGTLMTATTPTPVELN